MTEKKIVAERRKAEEPEVGVSWHCGKEVCLEEAFLSIAGHPDLAKPQSAGHVPTGSHESIGEKSRVPGGKQMDDLREQEARELVKVLRDSPANCGLLAMQGIVVMRCPGAPYTDTPTRFNESVLHDAIALSLLEKHKASGSYKWEYYMAKK
ncbi:MAG TPA: hypothetical protein VGR03_07805 [Candidatus Acidoferrum sp.]|nr:hypothetical protein [Candidatus Acidoferrum sp.]